MIYVTPFRGEQAAPSTDSGFASFDGVRAVMGPPRYEWPGGLIYGDSDGEQFLFSRLRWVASDRKSSIDRK